MTDQAAAIYQYIVRELAPHEAGAGEAPITIVCEPLSDQESPGFGGALSMRLNPGTTPDEAREIASLQSNPSGWWQLPTATSGLRFAVQD